MIFIDSGALIARYLKRDQYYNNAAPLWKWLQDSTISTYTSNFVIDETITFLARNAGYDCL